MLQEFEKHIDQNFPFLKDKKLLIAISGGIDSVVLTHLFSKLNIAEVALAHCNFQLRRKESDLDEEFVKNLGEKLNIPTFTTRFTTEEFAKKNKLSIQVAARKLRYNWFQELIEKHSFDYLLTAHHADDNLETFLINLTRGTGLEGLTGIPVINKNIVRPLLIFSREEIEDFAKKNSINWREDASNSQTKYLRNKIRCEIVPKLKEINPNLLDSFQKTSTFLQESEQIVNDSIAKISSEILSEENNCIKIDIEKLLQVSNQKAYLYQLLKTYNFTEWNDVTNLLNAKSGKQVFSKTHRLVKDRRFLLLSAITFSEEKEIYFIKKNQTETVVPISLKFIENLKKYSQKKDVIQVDKDVLKYPLIIRKWKKGDYFYPSGMSGKKKKLSKFFKDEKLSLLEKENIWLLCTAEDKIIWIINKRQDYRFLINTHTKNPILIKYIL